MKASEKSGAFLIPQNHNNKNSTEEMSGFIKELGCDGLI